MNKHEQYKLLRQTCYAYFVLKKTGDSYLISTVKFNPVMRMTFRIVIPAAEILAQKGNVIWVSKIFAKIERIDYE